MPIYDKVSHGKSTLPDGPQKALPHLGRDEGLPEPLPGLRVSPQLRLPSPTDV